LTDLLTASAPEKHSAQCLRVLTFPKNIRFFEKTIDIIGLAEQTYRELEKPEMPQKHFLQNL
jgi:hypothetical protein